MYSQAFEYTTANESHGPGLTAIIKNIPAGFKIDLDKIDFQLARRQKGYGRGGRMKIETDKVEVLAGIRHGETTGSPLCLFIKNKDYENWQNKEVEDFTRPRPAHADLSGGIKYRRSDLRDILERSSARETAIRVAVGAVAKQILEEFNINIASFVSVLGGIKTDADFNNYSLDEIREITEESELRLLNRSKEEQIKKQIDECQQKGDTLGGAFYILADGLVPALGSFNIPENKLDARIAFSMVSLQAIKAVEFGIGSEYANLSGSEAHDEIFYNEERGFYRKSNRCGGIEGGMSNGEKIIVKVVMKAIPTLMSPLKSVDIKSKKPFDAVKERSDITAVPAAAVVCENLLAIEILRAIMERYGFDEKSMILKHFHEDLKRFEWLD